MEIKAKVARWALPLLDPRRYRGIKGGRSGGKSHQLAEFAAEKMASNPSYKVAGIREVQKSIKFSLKSLLEQKIYEQGASYLFDMQDQVIKRRGGDGVAVFLGMQDHTADSVKGLEDFDHALVDEANSLSETSLKKLTPTFRKEGSTLDFAWNPESEDDAVDKFFAENAGHPDFLCLHVNIDDNPFVSATAWAEYERERIKADAARDRVAAAVRRKEEPEARDLAIVDTFEHVWRGAYNKRSQSLVFHNWKKKLIEPPDNVVWFYGADWGFATDPSAGVKCCYIQTPKEDVPDILYFRQAISQHGVRIDDLPAFLCKLEGIRDWPSRGDSARPDTIDYVRRNGLPKMRPAEKGPGSVEDGVTFLQSVEIVLHPTDCAPLEEELKRYSYKVVKRTGEILPVVADEWNHCIDAARYAVERAHRKGKLIEAPVIEEPDRLIRPRDYRDHGEDADSWRTV